MITAGPGTAVTALWPRTPWASIIVRSASATTPGSLTMLLWMAELGTGIVPAAVTSSLPVPARTSTSLTMLEPMSTLTYCSSRLNGLRSDRETVSRRLTRFLQSTALGMIPPHPLLPHSGRLAVSNPCCRREY
jgi:hypothetical protein